jgi:hypothetical protein
MQTKHCLTPNRSHDIQTYRPSNKRARETDTRQKHSSRALPIHEMSLNKLKMQRGTSRTPEGLLELLL